MNFFRAVAQETLEITDKAVYVPLTGGFQYDVLVVVIPETDQEKGQVNKKVYCVPKLFAVN